MSRLEKVLFILSGVILVIVILKISIAFVPILILYFYLIIYLIYKRFEK